MNYHTINFLIKVQLSVSYQNDDYFLIIHFMLKNIS